MDISETLYVTDRKEWRDWLETYFDKKKEIWLLFPKKSSNRKRLLYNDAVEEALCFGWVDSTIKNVDETQTAQRFSPRKPRSKYSQSNKERLAWLLERDLVHPSFRSEAEGAVKEEFRFPPDIMEAIRSHAEAWKNYENFPPAYKRIRVAYIDAARKRPEEFKRRLASFLKICVQNKVVGYGGIEKYYR